MSLGQLKTTFNINCSKQAPARCRRSSIQKLLRATLASFVVARTTEASAQETKSSAQEPPVLLEQAEVQLPSTQAADAPGSPAPSRAESPVTPAEPAVAPPIAEVSVRGTASEARRRVQSAEAVTVVDLRDARRRSSDLGEVLARTQGVAVRRSGGLGSETRFSLNGLYDDQIRFFLDGVPLDLAGYPFGVANVPVNLVERVTIYRGVVPVRFGADALGGAVDLETSRRYDDRISASYQAGSFGTQRLSFDARTRHEATGLVLAASGFADAARNNYFVDVEVPNARGQLRPARVRRFHDGYVAYGGSVELGVVDRSWAKRLVLRGFWSRYDKELQNNVVMTVPYGEVTFGESVGGATLRYEQPLARSVGLDLLAAYSRRTIEFVDRGEWIYDWFGRRTGQRRVAGEIEAQPTDRVVWQDAGFARATLSWSPSPTHSFRASTTPSSTTRSGDERIQADPAARDPLTAKRDLFTLVSGIEHQLDLLRDAGSDVTDSGLGGRFENVAFVKDYLYRASSEEALPGGVFRPLSRDAHRLGVGDSVRYRIAPWLIMKASYEYATRLPRPDEVFGNGVLITPNLALEPEVSHNGNLGPRFDLRKTKAGDLAVDVNAFLRDSDRLIVLLGNDRYFAYQNVLRARGVGVEGSVAWTTPLRWLTLDGSGTWQDVRNASTEGAFGSFEGDRIPNRPWLFASWGARVRIRDVLRPTDFVEPFYLGRYVHEFFRGWESQGLRAFKQVVDAQLTHGLGVTYSAEARGTRVASSLEVQNLTNARVYDFFGVQRPGRAFFVKVTVER